jgi:hypothetical protein
MFGTVALIKSAGFTYLITIVAIVGGIGSIIWSWNKTLRKRIVGLILLYVAILLIFASLYFLIFLHRPTAYSFSSSIQEGKIYDEFADTYSSYLRLSDQLYLLAILYSHPDIMLKAKNDTSTSHPMVEGKTVRVYARGSRGGKIYGGFELTDGETSYAFPFLNPLLARENAAASVISSKNEDECRKGVMSLIKVVAEEQKQTGDSLRLQIEGKGNLGLIDFCYFSAITMTTVGYGDILPNSRLVRLVVMFQTLVGVFYVGFALTFLWPRQVDN